LLDCAVLPRDNYCTACWCGKYKLPVDISLNRFSMEAHQLSLLDDLEETDD